MIKNQNKFANTTLEQWKRIFGAAIIMMMFMAFSSGVMFVSADALDTVIGIVTEIVGKAATYIGVVIVIWGVFQIILAFRREDSEGISKQITTVVVGGVLAGFGLIIPRLAGALGVQVG